MFKKNVDGGRMLVIVLGSFLSGLCWERGEIMVNALIILSHTFPTKNDQAFFPKSGRT